MKEIKTQQEIPQEKHLAVLEFIQESIYHEGDERSRTDPGHGYSAYTETRHKVIYTTFKDAQEMSDWILKATKEKANFQAVEVRPLTHKIQASVSYD